MKKNLLGRCALVLVLLCNLQVIAQRKSKKQKNDKPESSFAIAASPKLVVGIVVDQMRYDYLTRFWGHYGNGGFKRLVSEGFNCKNNHYNYAPTSTGPGHTSIYTGTTPSMHGIIGNNWFDKEKGEMVYCAADDSQTSVGASGKVGKMSPHRMLVTTVTDQLRLHTQMRGKTIAIAIKDRGAVLPGGHTANGAYWFHGSDEGNWVTSSYYMNSLPKWVDAFNTSRAVDQYKKAWTTLKDISSYRESGTDNNAYEGLFDGETTPTFPHDLPKLWQENSKYEILKSTPYGNSLTTDFAVAAIKGESLGKDQDPDFLAISYSSTDYVGHKYGVNSKEIQDTYIRLDEDLERLLTTLDRQVGPGEYTVFLTSDHGAVQVPKFLADHKIPAGYIQDEVLKPFFDFLRYTYGTADIVKNVSNGQLFLDRDIIANLDMRIETVQEVIANELITFKHIYKVYTAHQMWSSLYDRGLPYVLQNGFNQERSGDILMIFKPGTIAYPKTGSSHGSPHIYDTHVPLLFYGNGIQKGSTVKRTEIIDAAPTISALLGIAFPNGSTGKPVVKAIK